jgi:hypothetical protein
MAGALVPPVVVTVTLTAPTGALAAIADVAVIWVGLATDTLETVMPELGAVITVAPGAKFVPVSATETLAPWRPAAGLSALNVGGEAAAMVTTVVDGSESRDISTAQRAWTLPYRHRAQTRRETK